MQGDKKENDASNPRRERSASVIAEPVISATGLARTFGRTEAVKDVSFSVGAGEVFGFLGPNGAGKTTTINMLCTLLKPSAGRATVAGYDIAARRTEIRRSIGLVFQDLTLDEYLTAIQNLRFHAYAYAVPKRIREDRIRELLTLMGLWDRRNDSVRQYSGGMKRRLEIARGLLHHPHILFLDEPTLGLDPQTRHRIWRYVLDLRRREGLTIFLTTHYMDEAENCDRIAIIDQGEIVALDRPEVLKDSLGGDLVTLRTGNVKGALREITARYGLKASFDDDAVSFYVERGEEFVPEFVRSFPFEIRAVGVRRPTLDDVFLSLTGHTIRDQRANTGDQIRRFVNTPGTKMQTY
ncbi:MAG: ATP-binding cassette domain-containing protein [Gaiellaceae bacterium]|jgi:ABC-2 type transport system ATP-binding protein